MLAIFSVFDVYLLMQNCIDLNFVLMLFSAKHCTILAQLLETEIRRLNHLRDRASEMGHRKEYPLICLMLMFILFSGQLTADGK